MASTNGSREAVLARIRAALKRPASQSCAPLHSPVFPSVNPDLVESFRLQCKANLVDCFVTASPSESAGTLRQILAALPEGGVFAQASDELRHLLTGSDRHVQWSSEGAPRQSAQATVTHCEALVAATGTVIVSSECGGRGGSVIAPVHVVVANASQLLGDLEDAFTRLNQTGAPIHNSFVGFITGCSRTADIEKILVIGAHGPRRVLVILQTNC